MLYKKGSEEKFFGKQKTLCWLNKNNLYYDLISHLSIQFFFLYFNIATNTMKTTTNVKSNIPSLDQMICLVFSYLLLYNICKWVSECVCAVLSHVILSFNFLPWQTFIIIYPSINKNTVTLCYKKKKNVNIQKKS